MIVANPMVESLLPELFALLDQTTAAMGERLSHMRQLSAYVLERRQESMEPLLDQMERAAREQELADAKLAAMRTTLAKAIGVPVAEFRLSRLQAELSPRDAAPLQFRREQVLALAGQLRSEHLHAAVLLNEAARVNRAMLDSLMGAVGVATYGPGGDKHYDSCQGLVNAER
ncbi:MAG: hypothetical protein FWE88_01320 [Phycisphaerae bacterium]|nr:hypothetical protein [Phycisphaerae bacterium]